MTDLSTTFLGLKLKNPLVASASPLSKRVETVKKLEAAGVSAVVLYSLFEEQINNESKTLDHFLSFGTNSFQEATSFYPDFDHYDVGPDGYLDHIGKLKKAVSIPVIASLNGVSKGGWVDYAHRMEEAGADAVELNFYFIPTRLNLTAAGLEQNFVQLVKAVREKIKIPLTVKLSSAFTSLPQFTSELVKGGANGLTIFNRFLQPDFDLEKMEVDPKMVLSTSEELRLPLRWTAILYGKVNADIALTTGVHTGIDIVKAILAGASVTMIASELVEKGPARAAGMLQELSTWMTEHEYDSVTQMMGAMSQKSVAEPAAFERGNYMKALQTFDNRLF
jgi:dihydroorotate dehydrogenase (fumarate)